MPIFIGIGDRVSGPLIGLFFDAPSTPEQLAGPTDLTPAHGHPSDNFRIVMKGELWVGQERYHHGEFRLQRSGRPYGSDGDAPDVEGNWRVIMFGDRRGFGVRPTNPELRAKLSSPEAVAQTKAYFGALLTDILDDRDDGVEGLVTTIDKPFSKLGHIDGSFTESDTWTPIGDGAHAAVNLLSLHDIGPVVMLQRTPAGAVATPAATFASDVFRCVIAGSHQRAGVTVQMGDTRTQTAGVPWDPVVAGPDGLDELIVIGDRRDAIPMVEHDEAGWAAGLDAIVAGLRPGLDSLVAV
jgi:hypothetical protein